MVIYNLGGRQPPLLSLVPGRQPELRSNKLCGLNPPTFIRIRIRIIIIWSSSLSVVVHKLPTAPAVAGDAVAGDDCGVGGVDGAKGGVFIDCA